VRFKLDQNIPGDAASLLRAAGHEVQSVVDEHVEGTPDAQLLDACRNESRLLITLDLDFPDNSRVPASSHPHICRLRTHRCSTQTRPGTILSRRKRVNTINLTNHSIRHQLQKMGEEGPCGRAVTFDGYIGIDL